jgi:hypothetical protein
MKILVSILFLFTLFCSQMSLAIDMTAQTGFQYDWWKDNKDNKGSQFYVPMSFEAQYRDLSVKLLTGEAYTYVNPAGSSSQSLTHLLDTKLNLSYEMLEKLPVDVLIGLDFNLPTGKMDFKGRQWNFVRDPDLVSITQLGEGFNINPTVSLAKGFGNLVAGIGIGYLWRGEYDTNTIVFERSILSGPTDTFSTRRYGPGDILNATFELGYDFTPQWHYRLFGSYTWFGKDKIDSHTFYQEGQIFILGIGLSYDQKKWGAGLTVRSIFRDKSEFKKNLTVDIFSTEVSSALFNQWLSQPLSTEERNSHGDEWIADLSLKYLLDEKTTLRSSLQGLLITKNDYSSNSPFFIGQREKLSLGLALRRKLLSFLEGELYGKGFLMHDEERLFPEFLSERNYSGYSLGLLLTGRF